MELILLAGYLLWWNRIHVYSRRKEALNRMGRLAGVAHSIHGPYRRRRR